MGTDVAREAQSLEAELGRLGERFEKQTRYVEVLERKLRGMLEETGVASLSVTLADPLPALDGGVSLASDPGEGEPPYQAFPASGETADKAPATDDSWWPRPEAARRPLEPNAGWRNYALHGHVAKVVGVSVCGLSRPVLESTVAAIAGQQDLLRDFIPVFLTDCTEFDVFRRHGFVWEYFPGPAERARYGGDRSWADYAARRRALLERKWGLDEVICIGPAEFGRIEAAADAEPQAERLAAPAPAPDEAPRPSPDATEKPKRQAGLRYRLPRRKRPVRKPRFS
jgi:hypothetical protein